MRVNRALVRQETLFVRAVRDSHNVHVSKLRPGFAPVTMREDVMPPDFAARFDFASGRNGPVEQSVKLCHTHATSRWFHVFEESGKTPDDFSARKRLGGFKKRLQRHARFLSARAPRRTSDFIRRKLAFEREQHLPLQLA